MNKQSHGTLLSYCIGFGLSIALTLAAFWAVQAHVNSHHTFISDPWLIGIIVGLAVIQLVIQLLFFLHMGNEKGPRWNQLAFVLMVIFLVILVFGSLWIMNNLNYHMTPSQTTNFIIQDEGIHQ